MPGAKTIVRVVVRVVAAVVALAVVVVIVAWIEGFFESRIPPGQAAAEVRSAEGLPTATVDWMTTPETVDAVGTVEPKEKAEVASKLLATVQEVHVEPGDRVKRQQLLVVLDDREVQAQLREVEAARLGVEADLAVRQRDFLRYQQMFAEKAVTKEQFDRVEGLYKVTQAQLKRMDAQIDRLKVMLSYTQIKAPSAGIVADRYVDPGDLASPGKPLLTLHDPAGLELHASVREKLSGYVRLGQRLSVSIDAVNLQLTGTVREIVPQAEARSRSVLVKVSLPKDRTERLYIGMFGRLAIPVGKIRRIVVPREAVRSVGQLDLVEVVTPDNLLERRYVRPGKQFGSKIEILSGLRVGETVALFPEGVARR